MNDRFNIGLIPQIHDDAQCFTKKAALLARLSDDYLCGRGSDPHCTLAQFSAPRGALPAIWASVATLPMPDWLAPLGVYIDAGAGSHDGFDWIGWTIESEPELYAAQSAVLRVLDEAGLNVHTGSIYKPHVTACRVPTGAITPADLDMLNPLPAPFTVTLALADCSANGEWKKTIYRL